MTSIDLAEALEYDEIVEILSSFLRSQNLQKYLKFQMQELKKVNSRRQKYSILMEQAAKSQLDDYRKKNLFKLKFDSRDYHALKRIRLNENVILSGSSPSIASPF